MTTSSTNYTGLYSGNVSGAVPNTAYGNANVVSLLATSTDGANTIGNISATGNISGGNLRTAGQVSATGNITTAGYFLGTFAGNISGNLTVPGSNTQVLYNNSGNAGASAGFTFNSASNVVTVTGNIAGGNLSTAVNVIRNYILGYGSQLTGLPATYGNANVVANLAALGTNPVSTTGNVSAGYFLGNGSQLTGLAATYGNANVVTLLAAFGSNTISTTGTVTAGNITGGNVLTGGVVSATGNVTGNYILGNGSQLTGLPATYGNANVVSLLASFGSNAISTTGNVTAGYVIGNGSLLTNLTGGNVTGSVAQANLANTANSVAGANVTGQVANALIAGTVYTNAQPNITSVGTLTSATVTGNITGGNILTGGIVSATGNITGNVFSGNGSGLTNINAANIVGAYGNANVANFLGNYGSNTISTTGNISAGNVLLGDLLGAGNVTATGNVTGANIIGNGSLLSSITGANVTGTVANATYATSAGTAGTANTAVTVTGNAQANITSVGILTSLSVSGNITSGNVSTNSVAATGSGGLALKNSAGTTQASLGAGGGDNFAISVSTNINGANAQIDISPTGNSGHVHIKPTGTPSIEIVPTYPGSINNMVIGNITPAAVSATTVSASGNVTGNYFIGNGSQLTGIISSYGNANVTTLLASFGSNSISTTGNVTAGYFAGNGSLLTAITGANVTGTVANATFATSAGTAVTVTGNAQANITSVGVLTSLSVTGNITGGNVITANVLAGNISIVSNFIRNINAVNASTTPTPDRILMGNGYNGDYSAAYDPLTITRGGILQIINRVAVANTQTNTGVRQFTSTQYADLSDQIYSSGTYRISGGSLTNFVGNGTYTATGAQWASLSGGASLIVVGNVGNVTMGNATISHAVGAVQTVIAGTGGNIGNAVAVAASINLFSVTGNVTSGIAYATQLVNIAGITTAPTTAIGFYHPGNTNVYGSGTGNTWRSATNYYAFKNDDSAAQVQLGSMRAYHTFQAAGTATGTWNIDKSAGQVQAVSATGNITIGSYTNFVTTANDGTNNDSQTDTVTLIIEQGATPYTVTMPTGNAAIRYAGNVTTVSNVANSTTMIAVTAYRTAANATGYLTTISPGFV